MLFCSCVTGPHGAAREARRTLCCRSAGLFVFLSIYVVRETRYSFVIVYVTDDFGECD